MNKDTAYSRGDVFYCSTCIHIRIHTTGKALGCEASYAMPWRALVEDSSVLRATGDKKAVIIWKCYERTGKW